MPGEEGGARRGQEAGCPFPPLPRIPRFWPFLCNNLGTQCVDCFPQLWGTL